MKLKIIFILLLLGLPFALVAQEQEFAPTVLPPGAGASSASPAPTGVGASSAGPAPAGVSASSAGPAPIAPPGAPSGGPVTGAATSSIPYVPPKFEVNAVTGADNKPWIMTGGVGPAQASGEWIGGQWGAAEAGGISSLGGLPKESNDLSKLYLSYIFGVVDGVLQGSGTQIIGKMFTVFNTSILTLGGIILVYILIVSTLRTAHEGEVLGKQWSSMWIPLRAVIGVSLLVPKASGYSVIQIFMMWVVVQGIAVANLVWGSALDYLGTGGVIVSQNMTNPTSAEQGSATDAMAGLFESLVCLYKVQEQATLSAKEQQKSVAAALQSGVTLQPQTPAIPPLNLINTVIPIQTPTSQTDVMAFSVPGDRNLPNAHKQVAGVCGEFNLNPKSDRDAFDRAVAVSQVISYLAPYAQQVAINGMYPTPPSMLYEATNIWQGMMAQAAARIANESAPSASSSGGNLLSGLSGLLPFQTGLESEAASKLSGLLPFEIWGGGAPALSPAQRLANEMQGMKDEGWIMAGKYYWTLTRFSTVGRPVSNPPLQTSGPNQGRISNYFGPDGRSYATRVLETVITDQGTSLVQCASNAASSGSITSFQCYKQLAKVYTPPGALQNQAGPDCNRTGNQIEGFSGIDDYTCTIENFGSEQASGINPVVRLANLGATLMEIAFTIFIVVVVTLIGAAAIVAWAWGFAAAAAVGTAAAIIGPFLAIIVTLMAVPGALLAYYVPLIPFWVFTFAALGWFIAVIEAMAAAPLLALGLIHPEGHEVLGQAQSAVTMIASLFLRPALMVFGFVVGIILSYVAMWMLHRGLGTSLRFISESNMNYGAFTRAFGSLVLMIFYATSAMEILTKCFSLTTHVPDRIMTWIGGQAMQYGGAESLQRMEGAATAAGRGAGEVATGGIKMTGEGVQAATKGANESGGGGGGGQPPGGGGGARPGAVAPSDAKAISAPGDRKGGGAAGGGGLPA